MAKTNTFKKRDAINHLKAVHCSLELYVTFASKNETIDTYWANPRFTLLDKDWTLILNDWNLEELHVFRIPAHTIEKTRLKPRKDHPEKIHLEIQYGDPDFTDKRSGVRFGPYLVTSVKY